MPNYSLRYPIPAEDHGEASSSPRECSFEWQRLSGSYWTTHLQHLVPDLPIRVSRRPPLAQSSIPIGKARVPCNMRKHQPTLLRSDLCLEIWQSSVRRNGGKYQGTC